jgi:hypothetical protein
MERQPILRLKPDVQHIKQNGRAGVSRQGRMQLVRDDVQEFILRQLSAGIQQIGQVKHLLEARDSAPPDDPRAALALAEFILDFADYLEG